MLPQKLKLLVLIKPFGKRYTKQKVKYDFFETLAKYADITFWHEDGDIRDILRKIGFKPDFIFHYDIAWNYRFAPKITGLSKINIPTGCLVIDIHYSPKKRRRYFKKRKIDLIFSATKYPFLAEFPEYKHKFRWLPFSINPSVYKDWGLEKSIKYLLMGQFYCEGLENPPKRIPPKGRYPFREEVFRIMSQYEQDEFVFHPHPGHYTRSKKAMVDINYAKELNRAAIFFTCGGKFKYPVLKFFEALACNTLLLAETNPDIEELGFKDGVHFVACTTDDFYPKAKYYTEHEKERKRIANAGYQFVHQNHTHDVRAKQLIEYINQYLKRSL